jgi:hypothetical protein
MLRELEAFAKSPTPTNFLSARAALLSQSQRPLSAEDISHLQALLDADEPAAVSEAIGALPPIAALSPAVHLMAARAAETAGDEQDCRLERYLLVTCLEAILQTGDGTEDSPYVVTCSMDERHVCEMLGLVPRSQALANRRGKALDVVECVSGASVWFDVSGLVSLPALEPRRKRNADHALAERRNKDRCLVPGRKRVSQTPR